MKDSSPLSFAAKPPSWSGFLPGGVFPPPASLLEYTKKHAYPPHVLQFVQRSLETGEYASEDDVVFAGVRALREVKQPLWSCIQIARWEWAAVR